MHTWAPCHDVIRRRMIVKDDPALDDTTAAMQGTSTNGPVIEADAGNPSGWPAALSHFGRSSGQAKQSRHRARRTRDTQVTGQSHPRTLQEIKRSSQAALSSSRVDTIASQPVGQPAATQHCTHSKPKTNSIPNGSW